MIDSFLRDIVYFSQSNRLKAHLIFIRGLDENLKGLSRTLADPLRSHWVYSAASNAAEHRDLLGD